MDRGNGSGEIVDKSAVHCVVMLSEYRPQAGAYERPNGREKGVKIERMRTGYKGYEN